MIDSVPDREDLILKICKYVQKTPFTVICDSHSYKGDVKHIIREHCGSCTHKHLLLGDMCDSLGLKVTYVLAPFYWQDLNVDYPESLQTLVKNMPRVEHTAVEVKIEDSVHLLDVTWDPPLKEYGFPVNEFGESLKKSDISLAVNPITPRFNFIRKRDPRDILKWKRKRTDASDRDLKNEFYLELDDWLRKIRSEN